MEFHPSALLVQDVHKSHSSRTFINSQFQNVHERGRNPSRMKALSPQGTPLNMNDRLGSIQPPNMYLITGSLMGVKRGGVR